MRKIGWEDEREGGRKVAAASVASAWLSNTYMCDV
jgi:hypothetical protein